MDTWDSKDGMEPEVTHGHTLTTRILFKEVLEDAIKPYAFVASRYPLILSLENHCNPELQDKMAFYLKTILREWLYVKDPDPDAEFLPSPESLLEKILVKAKGPAKEKDEVSFLTCKISAWNGLFV